MRTRKANPSSRRSQRSPGRRLTRRCSKASEFYGRFRVWEFRGSRFRGSEFNGKFTVSGLLPLLRVWGVVILALRIDHSETKGNL